VEEEISRHGILPTVAPVNPYTLLALTCRDGNKARPRSQNRDASHNDVKHLPAEPEWNEIQSAALEESEWPSSSPALKRWEVLLPTVDVAQGL
jgi:hypothetical protein